MIILEIIAALIIVITFGAVFQAPKKSLLLLGLTGSLCWASFLFAQYLGNNIVIASFIAAFIVGICGEVFARLIKLPVTVFVIAGIIPLVPGVPAYNTMLFFIKREYIMGVEEGINTLMIAGAIAFAIALTGSGAKYYKEFKLNSKRKRG